MNPLNRERLLAIKRAKMREKRKISREKKSKEELRLAQLNEKKVDNRERISKKSEKTLVRRVTRYGGQYIEKKKVLRKKQKVNDKFENGVQLDEFPSNVQLSDVSTLTKQLHDYSSDTTFKETIDEYSDYASNIFVSKRILELEKSLRNARKRESKRKREINKLREKIKNEIKLKNTWKLRCFRLRKLSNIDPLLEKVNKIEKKGKNEVRKRLLYCEALETQLKDRKKSLKNERERSLFSQMVCGTSMKKYGFSSRFATVTSKYYQRKYFHGNQITFERKKIKSTMIKEKIQRSVRQFLERDENSSMSPGSRDTITKRGECKRKRYLCDTMINLHAKYLKTESFVISKTMFYRCKPFWCIKKTLSARDTCLCRVHVNFDFLIQKLAYLRVLHSNNTLTFIKSIACDINSKKCMYRECPTCKYRQVKRMNSDKPTFYYKWITQKENRIGSKNQIFNVQVTSKSKINCTISKMVQEINSFIPSYLKHIYDTQHQLTFLRNNKMNLNPNEVQIVIDFSENYVCKCSEEIQSAHFGASKKQLTFHTGVFYYRDLPGSELKCVSFCTVSESLRHDASAVWAHLQPVLELIKSMLPHVNALHFQSDGPTTQYKNKTNFHLFHHHCKKLKIGHASWNFTTAGHGKSSADAIGGSTKRLCDQAVLAERDIMSADDVIQVINNAGCKIKIFLITPSDIQKIDTLIAPDITPAPQSNKIFQIIYNDSYPELFFLNYLSCSECFTNPPCHHYSLSTQGWSLKKVKHLKKKV